MKKAIALLLLGATDAVAQVTLAAILNNAANVAAGRIDENGADACSTANQLVFDCADQIGGIDELLTAAPSDLFNCACCSDGTPISEAFSDCSTYMVSEMPALSTLLDAYHDVYTACGLVGTCSASASSSSNDEDSSTPTPSSRTSIAASTTVASTSTTATDDSSSDSSLIASADTSTIANATESVGIITSLVSSWDPACTTMVNFFDSCVSATSGFADLPPIEQAPCYCCSQSNDELVWSDGVDSAAVDCAAWATSGDSSVWSVATMYTTFCEHFSDACEAVSTTSSTSQTSSEISSTPESTPSTTGAEETGSSNPEDAGAQLRVSAMAGLLALGALIVAL